MPAVWMNLQKKKEMDNTDIDRIEITDKLAAQLKDKSVCAGYGWNHLPGDTLFPFTKAFLQGLTDAGKRYVFLT